MGYGYFFGFKDTGRGSLRLLVLYLSQWFPRSGEGLSCEWFIKSVNNSVQVVNMDTLISGKVRSYHEFNIKWLCSV